MNFVSLIHQHFRPRRVKFPVFSDDALRRLDMPLLAIVDARDVLLHSAETKSRLERHAPKAEVVFLARRRTLHTRSSRESPGILKPGVLIDWVQQVANPACCLDSGCMVGHPSINSFDHRRGLVVWSAASEAYNTLRRDPYSRTTSTASYPSAEPQNVSAVVIARRPVHNSNWATRTDFSHRQSFILAAFGLIGPLFFRQVVEWAIDLFQPGDRIRASRSGGVNPVRVFAANHSFFPSQYPNQSVEGPAAKDLSGLPINRTSDLPPIDR